MEKNKIIESKFKKYFSKLPIKKLEKLQDVINDALQGNEIEYCINVKKQEDIERILNNDHLDLEYEYNDCIDKTNNRVLRIWGEDIYRIEEYAKSNNIEIETKMIINFENCNDKIMNFIKDAIENEIYEKNDVEFWQNDFIIVDKDFYFDGIEDVISNSIENKKSNEREM